MGCVWHTFLRSGGLRLRVNRPELILIGITMIWGATFLIIHVAMTHTGPLFFVGIRFVVAGLIGAAVFWRALRGITRHEIAAGAGIGVTIFIGHGLQTSGLQTITASQSAFITALYVPMVPLLQWALLRKAPGVMALVGVAFAFAGLVLLAGPDAGLSGLSTGETLTLLSAVACAVEIVLISRFAGTVDARRVTVVQVLVAGLLSFAMMPVAGEQVPKFSWVWLAAGVGLGAASILIQWAMNWAQRSVSATRATVIYAGEPVWGGIIGRLAGERLPGLAILGAVLIVVGVLVSELRPRVPETGRPPTPEAEESAGRDHLEAR
ncbi:EamA family transporter [Kocuria sp. CCUG 69068]|nr:EamA family transporter [Kocuria sp. CCUG 69068]